MADETFSTMESALDSCKAKENPLADNKVANFAYDDTAYENNNADGVESYDYNAHNNIPKGTPLVMDTNQTVLDKGYRSQASSITRMLMNHFFGRISYNLNKTVDTVNGLINNMKTFWGRPNGFATLDASGRIPFSQLPESAIEFKGLWDASTNTPTLADNTGTKGDFYIVSVAGTQNLGSGSIQFFVNDRVIYSGEVWTRLTSGDVQTVNGVHPQAGDVKNVIKLTQEQFDTLSSADRAGKFFIVTTSYAVGQSEINDNVTASDTTWSSNKIVSNLTGALANYTPISRINGILMENGDLNNYLDCGFYVTDAGSTYLHTPTGMDNHYFALQVIRTAEDGNKDYRNQILYKYQSNKIYTRSYHWQYEGMGWSDWQELATTSDLVKAKAIQVTTDANGLFSIDRSAYTTVVNIVSDGAYLQKWKVDGDNIYGYLVDWNDTVIANKNVWISLNYI